MLINFFFPEKQITLKNRAKLKTFIAGIFIAEKKNLESLTYVFCSDETLLSINKQFLKHDYYTDIITFDLSSGKEIIGEIHISIDRVRDNAKQLNVTLMEELHRVLFHGALHLCGYKDKSPKDALKMRKAEDLYLGKYGITPRSQ